MIYILHGEDTSSSYRRLNALTENRRKAEITKDSKKDEFLEKVFPLDLFGEKQAVVCENFLTKVSPADLKKIDQSALVIFWEQSQLKSQTLLKFKPYASIENFKPSPLIFYFLDSVSPDLKNTFSCLSKLDAEENILWNLTQRVLLLTIARSGKTIEEAQEQIKRRIDNWQWDKIKAQSKKFDPQKLSSLFDGCLKLDYTIKKGYTSLNQKTLITLLLLKYLGS